MSSSIVKPGPKDQKKTSLIMVSGGLDSTCALVWLLTKTNDLVHAHHIHLQNKENRSKAETKAIADVVKYCKKHYRNFRYTQSYWGMGNLYIPKDIYVYMFIAGVIALGHKNRLDRVVTGSVKTMIDLAHRREMSWQIFNIIYHSKPSNKKKIEWFRPLINMSKEEVYAAVPKELRKLTWSCRYPKYDKQGSALVCGQCFICMAMKRVRGELTPDQISNYKKWVE